MSDDKEFSIAVAAEPHKDKVPFPKIKFKSDMTLLTFGESAYADRGHEWVDKPIFQEDKLAGERPDPKLVKQLSEALYDNIFSGQPPESTGYIQEFKKLLRYEFPSGRKTSANAYLHFYRQPLVENPQTAEDYLYGVMANWQAIPWPGEPDFIWTAIVDSKGEKQVTALTNSKFKENHFRDFKFASIELIKATIASLSDPQKLLEEETKYLS